MATRTVSNAGGSFNTTGAWVEGVVPTSADDVVDTVTSGTLTITAGSACRSFIVPHCALAGTGDLSVGDGSGGAYTIGGTISGSWTTTLKATSDNSGTGWPVTFNGKSPVGNFTCDGVGGKWVPADNFSASTKTLQVTNGNLVLTNRTVTCANLIISAGGTCDIAGATFFVSRTSSGNALQVVSTATLTGGATSTIVVATTATVNRSIAGGSHAFGALIYTVAGSTGTLTISGNNTWASPWQLSDSSNTRGIIITAGSTQTFTSASNPFALVVGTSGKLVTFTSSTPGSFYTISSAVQVTTDFLSVTDCRAAGSAPFLAGSNSTLVSGNLGWFLTYPTANLMAFMT